MFSGVEQTTGAGLRSVSTEVYVQLLGQHAAVHDFREWLPCTRQTQIASAVALFAKQNNKVKKLQYVAVHFYYYSAFVRILITYFERTLHLYKTTIQSYLYSNN